MPADIAPVREALRVLRNVAPEEYAKFLDAFTKFKDDQVLTAAMAEQADVLVAQGAARQCLSLHRLMLETGEPAPR